VAIFDVIAGYDPAELVTAGQPEQAGLQLRFLDKNGAARRGAPAVHPMYQANARPITEEWPFARVGRSKGLAIQIGAYA
jgi:hypothetical protein